MKALLVYDSFFDNTQQIAEAVAQELGAKVVNVANVKVADLDALDLLVLGSPIRGWKPSEKTQAFLNGLKAGQLAGIKTTTFDTRVKLFIHGDAKEQMSSSMKSLGASTIVAPEAFYVGGKQDTPHLLDGEIDRAREWAKKIKAAL